jgi:WD40 repeat protein
VGLSILFLVICTGCYGLSWALRHDPRRNPELVRCLTWTLWVCFRYGHGTGLRHIRRENLFGSIYRIVKNENLLLLLLVVFFIGCRQAEEVETSVEQPVSQGRLSYEGAHSDEAVGRLGKGSINVTSFTPDGETIIAAGDVGVYVYSVESLEDLWSIPTANPIISLAVSSDGSMAALGTDDGSIVLLDLLSHKAIEGKLSQETDENGVFSLAWMEEDGADGSQLLAAGFNNGDVVISQINRDSTGETGVPEVEFIDNLDRQSSGVVSMAFSPNGRVLVTGTRNGLISIWETESSEWIGFLEGHEPAHAVLALDWLDDGRLLISGGRDDDLILWDMMSLQPLRFLPGHESETIALAIAPDGSSFGSVSADGQIVFWDALDQEPKRIDGPHLGALGSVAWSLEWDKLLAASPQGELVLWDIEDQSNIVGPKDVLLGHSKHGEWVMRVAWSPEGDRLATTRGQEITIWDADTRRPIDRLHGHETLVGGLDWSPDGTMLASGDGEGIVMIWDTSSGETLFTGDEHSSGITDLRWSPDGQQIASAGSLDDTVVIWEAVSGEVKHRLRGMESGIWSVGWSPDVDIVAGGTTNGEILIWKLDEMADGEPTRVIRRHLNWISGLSFSPDGKWLATSGADNRVVLTELDTDRAVTYPGHGDVVRSVEYSPDGTKLVTGARDELVIIWDVREPGENKTPLAVYSGHANGVNDARWSPDGRSVASGSDDGTVLLWPGVETETLNPNSQ